MIMITVSSSGSSCTKIIYFMTDVFAWLMIIFFLFYSTQP